MKLSDFIRGLQVLEANGHGNLEMFAVHGASGDVNPMGSAWIAAITGDEEYGPFDLDVGTKYVSVYIGN